MDLEASCTALESRYWVQSVASGKSAEPISFVLSNDTMTRMLTSLKIIRGYGCDLPVEIFGFRFELEALGDVRREIESLGQVEFRTVHSNPVGGAWKQFQIVSELTSC